MKSPSRIAADLRSLASKIERSNQPSKTLVASAIKRVLASMHNNDVQVIPKTQTEPGFLTFNVRGEFGGSDYEFDVTIELYGQGAEWDHISGVDRSFNPDDPWLDEEEKIFEAIYDTAAYNKAMSVL